MDINRLLAGPAGPGAPYFSSRSTIPSPYPGRPSGSSTTPTPQPNASRSRRQDTLRDDASFTDRSTISSTYPPSSSNSYSSQTTRSRRQDTLRSDASFTDRSTISSTYPPSSSNSYSSQPPRSTSLATSLSTSFSQEEPGSPYEAFGGRDSPEDYYDESGAQLDDDGLRIGSSSSRRVSTTLHASGKHEAPSDHLVNFGPTLGFVNRYVLAAWQRWLDDPHIFADPKPTPALSSWPPASPPCVIPLHHLRARL
jgi:hypothetical protein